MLMALAILVLLVTLWVLGAALLAGMRRITFHQAFFLLPLKLLRRIEDRSTRAVLSDPPVIYAVLHQSRVDPALMLSLLPSETLHILDETSARSFWLEPWREMARTIAFNARHVFVSRRLVRHLRGRGRLAVYFPDGLELETRAFRLYRAVAKIAAAADASVVAVSVQRVRNGGSSLPGERRRSLLGRLRVQALEPLSMSQLVSRSRRENPTMASALFDRVAEADAVG